MSSTFLGGVMAILATQPDSGAPPQNDPQAYPTAVVTAGQARFTVLTPAMIRMEWSPASMFEDRASFAFINRRMPVPKFRSSTIEGRLTLVTDELTLRYKVDGGAFAEENLSIEFKVGGKPVTWKPGMKDTGNLRGTTRTLDGVSGSCPLESGLLSRDGWTLVDDSQRLIFDSTPQSAIPATAGKLHPQFAIDWPWAAARQSPSPVSDDKRSDESTSAIPHSAFRTPHSLDWYFLAYGRDYKRALADFTKVAGRIPLPPRFVFGAWWSRYWAYSDEELKELVGEFKEHDVPLDVLVIDMDWHLDGWTGYTWNSKYFPDPNGFLKWVREQGLRAALNLHPADGVKKHEAAFPKFAEAMSLDPKTTDHIPFDCTDHRYVENYFKLLHHPLEKQGIDFWWIDWQQGKNTKIEGLDPLFWLNHLHWTDMERNSERGGKRPILFSRWGGLGNHRYQIGFSGDTFSNWASLAFQPYFTATAGNVGYAYWSHDIGGHQPGAVNPELYARWIQFGALSPALRTHTTKNPKAERRIWAFPGKDAPPSQGGNEGGMFVAARKAFHLRYELIPYIYTMARKCYDTGLPLCRPLYYEWPELDEAYVYGAEYLFGDDLLVAPVTQPASPLSGTAEVDVWIPPGEWTHWFTGRTYTGPTMATLMVPLDEIPLFVKSGGIIPAQPKMSRSGEKPVDPLILHVFPGASGETRVYEDDAETVGYQKNECAWTPVSVRVDADGTRHISIGPTEGEYPGMLNQRRFEIRIHNTFSPAAVTSAGANLAASSASDEPGWQYDRDDLLTTIRLAPQAVDRKLEVDVGVLATQDDERLLRDGLRGAYSLLRSAHPMHDLSAMLELLKAIEPSETQPAEMGTAAEFRHNWRKLPAFLRFGGKMLHTPPERRSELERIALRAAGLAFRISFEPSEADANHVQAIIRITPTLAITDLGAYSGKVQVGVDRPWVIRDDSEWESGDLTGGFRRVVSLACGDGLSTGHLHGQVQFRDGTTTFELPLESWFLPSINQWWVLGPFDCPFETKGLDCVFPPEEKIDLAASYDGKDRKKIAWKEAKRPLDPGADLTDEFFVHLHDFFGERHTNAIAYALAYLHAPRAMDASLALGSDDGVAVWLNGQEVHRSTIGRPYTPKQDRVPVKLNEGVNTLLLKVSQGGGDWGFGVHVETPDGKPLPAVRASLSPEK